MSRGAWHGLRYKCLVLSGASSSNRMPRGANVVYVAGPTKAFSPTRPDSDQGVHRWQLSDAVFVWRWLPALDRRGIMAPPRSRFERALEIPLDSLSSFHREGFITSPRYGHKDKRSMPLKIRARFRPITGLGMAQKRLEGLNGR